MDGLRAAMGRIAAIQATVGGGPAAIAASRGAETPGFALLLDQQLARQQAASATSTSTTWPTVNPTRNPTMSGGAPPGLEAYENGRIPAEALAPIPGGELLWAPAAAAFTTMAADAARAGVTLPVIDAYRPYEDQVRLADELGLYSEGGWAAVPGTSQHGWGRAIDLELDDAAVTWMRENAWRYGFHETVPREPWHWEFHP